jgi:hypothetical protein
MGSVLELAVALYAVVELARFVVTPFGFSLTSALLQRPESFVAVSICLVIVAVTTGRFPGLAADAIGVGLLASSVLALALGATCPTGIAEFVVFGSVAGAIAGVRRG